MAFAQPHKKADNAMMKDSRRPTPKSSLGHSSFNDSPGNPYRSLAAEHKLSTAYQEANAVDSTADESGQSPAPRRPQETLNAAMKMIKPEGDHAASVPTRYRSGGQTGKLVVRRASAADVRVSTGSGVGDQNAVSVPHDGALSQHSTGTADHEPDSVASKGSIMEEGPIDAMRPPSGPAAAFAISHAQGYGSELTVKLRSLAARPPSHSTAGQSASGGYASPSSISTNPFVANNVARKTQFSAAMNSGALGPQAPATGTTAFVALDSSAAVPGQGHPSFSITSHMLSSNSSMMFSQTMHPHMSKGYAHYSAANSVAEWQGKHNRDLLSSSQHLQASQTLLSSAHMNAYDSVSPSGPPRPGTDNLSDAIRNAIGVFADKYLETQQPK